MVADCQTLFFMLVRLPESVASASYRAVEIPKLVGLAYVG